MTSPNAGTVTIVERQGTSSPAGYELLDWRAEITAPAASSAAPLQLSFWLDPSVSRALDAASVQVFRNGAAVAPCDDPPAGSAAPDPCVAGRQTLASGAVQLDVRTSAASAWTFGRMLDATPPAVSILSPANGVAYTLGQSVVADYACTDPGSGVGTCAGPVADGAELDTAAAGSRSFTATATDVAGNTTTATNAYDVLAGSATATAVGPGRRHHRPGRPRRRRPCPCSRGSMSPPERPGSSPSRHGRRCRPRPAGRPPGAVATTGPAVASPAAPHVLTFTLDASVVGSVPAALVDVVAGGAWWRRARSAAPA